MPCRIVSAPHIWKHAEGIFSWKVRGSFLVSRELKSQRSFGRCKSIATGSELEHNMDIIFRFGQRISSCFQTRYDPVHVQVDRDSNTMCSRPLGDFTILTCPSSLYQLAFTLSYHVRVSCKLSARALGVS